jgi:hypothetical protein
VLDGPKSKLSASFPKVVTLTPKLRARYERRWERDVTKMVFRQIPPPETKFQAIGSFHWPVDDYRPEEALGASYEALDRIRMDCSCYVVFWKARNLFQIMGEEANVDAGLERMRMVCAQIEARQISNVRQYVLRWPAPEKMPSTVYLHPYEKPETSAANGDAPETLANTPRGDDYIKDDDLTEPLQIREEIDTRHAKDRILETIERLHFYRGILHMRVRLGTFLVDQYKIPKDNGHYQVMDFQDMIKASQFIGHVTKEYVYMM